MIAKPGTPQRRLRRRELALTGLGLVAMLALAAGLRFYRLDGQSLWNDEGTSVALASRTLAEITRGAAADIHPPFYYYLLHYWQALFGNSEAAVRLLSALLGVAVVGVTGLLGRRLFGPLAGWSAALMTAFSAYQVYYSQEARMYILLTLLGAASTLLFYEGWLAPAERPRWWAIAGWIVVTALAAYTHYLAAAVVLAQNVAWVAGLWLAARQPGSRGMGLLRQALVWAGAQALVGALYLPWLRLTWAQLQRWPAVSQPFGLYDLLRQALPLFVLGPTAETGPLRGLVVAVLGLALAGLLWPDQAGQRSAGGRILALAYWAAPLAVLYYLAHSRPVFHPKFLVAATPGLALLAARGVARLSPEGQAGMGRSVVRLRSVAACTAALVAVAANLPGLHNYYYDPRYARDDYRGLVEYISALGQPGDAILINAPGQIETVDYYYDGPLPIVPLPLQRPPDRAATIRELEALAARSQRIFGIFWATNESDPERIIEGWLDSHAYKALDAWYGNVRLVIYALPSARMGLEMQHPLNVNLGGRVRLAGYSLANTEVQTGDILQLTLFWEATNVIQRRYKVFTHVMDDGQRLVGQRDAEPGGGQHLTTSWREGERIVDRYGLPIQPGTPPGEYLIAVGMYDPEDGARLPVVEEDRAVADHVILQRVRVVRPPAPPPLAVLDMQRRHPLKGDEIQLLGFSFGRLGGGPPDGRTFRANDPLELVLFWQALRAPKHDVQLVMRIVDRSGQVRLEQRALPVAGRYPVRNWQEGEIVRDIQHLRLPSHLPPGGYRLQLGWQDAPPATGQVELHPLLEFAVQ